MGDVTRKAVAQLLAQLRAQTSDQAARLEGTERATAHLRRTIERRTAQASAELRAKAHLWVEGQIASVTATTAAKEDGALREASRLASSLAPGALGASWDSLISPELHPPSGHHVRVGEIDGWAVPAVLPLFGATGWQVHADGTSFAGLAHALVLRSLAAYGPDRVRVQAFDPGLISDLGLYASVREVDPHSVPPALTTNGALESTLKHLADSLGTVADNLAAAGRRSVVEETIDDTLVHPLHLLIIYDSSFALSSESRHTLAQLLRIGGPRGLFVLARAEPLERLLEEDTPAGLTRVSIQGRTCAAASLPGVFITLDAPPLRSQILAVCETLAQRPRRNTAPALPLESLIKAIPDPWIDPGDQGLEVTYGRAGKTDLVLRLRSHDPPMPNALIGGAVGEGKSNLLLDIVYGLAARYSPAELEMILLDLKDGVEFASLGPNAAGRDWLPHVRVLGLDFDRVFALAVLEWVITLLAERGALFREAGVANIGEYRATGRQMPRVLVVIDEFQRLFEGSDEQIDQAALLLESLARTARSAGVHLVLASQTISGIRGLAAKSDAIFAQFHNRISLRNTLAESQAILGPHNAAAAHLSHRGEVIHNEAHGQDPERNKRGLSAHAERPYLRSLQARLWSEGSTGVPPRVFRASAFARRPPIGDAPERVLGMLSPGAPISVEEDMRVVTLTRSPDQTVLVLGTERSLVLPVLVSSVDTWIRTKPEYEVLILDGLSSGTAQDPTVGALLQALPTDARVRVVPNSAIQRVLAELSAREAESGPVLIVPVALDGSIELEKEDPATYSAPIEDLRAIVRMGGLRCLAVVGWWQSLSRAEAQLGYGLPGVRAFALCGVGNADVGAAVGPGVKAPEGYPRALWFDRSSARGPEVLVPFELPAQVLEVLRG